MKQGRYTIFYCGISLIYHGIYTYTDIIGESLDWSNIVIFFGVAGLVYLVETKMFLGNKTCRIPSEYAFAMYCILCIYLLSARDSVLSGFCQQNICFFCYEF